MSAETTLDPARQQRAKIYARIQRRLMAAGLIIGLAYLLLWLFSGWSAAYKAWLLRFTVNEWLLVAAFALGFGGVLIFINLPLSFYEGYILPHRFELSTQTLRGWISDQLKMGLLSGLLGLFILEITYALLRGAGAAWWLWVAGFLLLFNVVLANLAPVLLLPLFYKLQPLGEGRADLEQRLQRLAEKAGTQVRGVFKFDMSRRTVAANAALTGLGNTRRILLGDTLLNEFSDDEIETVLAHELAHHVHKDIPTGMLVQSLLTLVGLYLAHLGLRWGVGVFAFSGIGDIAGLPLFALVMSLFGLFTMPLGNAYSRWRERNADIYALRATGNPYAFISAMTRLANQNLAEVDPEPWVEFLLYSHPALRKRIELANLWKA